MPICSASGAAVSSGALPVRGFAIEATVRYGAGLNRRLLGAGLFVVEATRPAETGKRTATTARPIRCTCSARPALAGRRPDCTNAHLYFGEIDGTLTRHPLTQSAIVAGTVSTVARHDTGAATR